MGKKILIVTVVLSLFMVSFVLAQKVETFKGNVDKVLVLWVTKGGNLVFNGVGLKLANYPDVTFVVAKKDVTRFKVAKKLKGGDYEVDGALLTGKEVVISGSKAAGAEKEIQVLNLKFK